MPPPPPTPPAAASAPLIGGCYAIDFQQPLADAGGGLPCFAATDRRNGHTGLMAVQVPPQAPPRAQALALLVQAQNESLLLPLAHGPATPPDGAPCWLVISPAPPGKPLWPPGAASQPSWSEPALLDCLLRPAAAALAWLQARHLTHRAIRPDNVFRAAAGDPVTLGAAWATPPALLQPALFEPPYSAMCLPAGRGAGSIADDVYALGVLLLTLALGRLPLAGLDDRAIIRAKLERGSFAALAGEARLPPAIADLARGMLAEDPEHRPPPALLADPVAARARRVAARPPPRAQQPLATPSGPVWNARGLAHAIAVNPGHGAQLLRSGAVDRWLRHGLGVPGLAVRLDEATRQHQPDADDAHADALLALCATALLDPLAPLAWRGHALWPDGIGPLLAATPERDAALANLIDSEAIAAWAALRADRADPAPLATEAHQLRALLHLRGWAGGAPRLRYALNPLLPCASPLLAGHCVARLTALLPALEAAGADPDTTSLLPIDREIAAFLAARSEHRVEAPLAALAAARAPEAAALAQLRLLAPLQQRLTPAPLPQLAGWLGAHAAPCLSRWQHRRRRAALTAALTTAIQAGSLAQMLAVLDDPTLEADAQGVRRATQAVQALDQALATLTAGAPQRAQAARRIGQDAMLGLGLSAVAVAAIATLLG